MLKAGREPSVSLSQNQLSEEDRAKLKVTQLKGCELTRTVVVSQSLPKSFSTTNSSYFWTHYAHGKKAAAKKVITTV